MYCHYHYVNMYKKIPGGQIFKGLQDQITEDFGLIVKRSWKHTLVNYIVILLIYLIIV